ncbi:MAG: patatin-like phospholipase family protein [Blastocatellia bacterium]
MRIARPQDVHYLALEGGGGKGVTYLGAVRALERLGVLPIDIERPGQNQVKGISGASAGAITALLLAMGLRSTEIERILSQPQTFVKFFDEPAEGRLRSVNRQNRQDIWTGAPTGISVGEFVQNRKKQISGKLSNLVGIFAYLVANGLFGTLNDPIVQRLTSSPDHYLYNLVFDRGLFPGFAPRNFFTRAISGYLSRKILQYTGGRIITPLSGGDLNFDLFYQMTGVDLVITGANVTKHRPGVFSRRHTPRFPVAEAVGISMNLPVLFKPVYVEADVPAGRGQLNANADDYHGFWVDGGVLNNFPLHAFDHLSPQVSTRYPDLRPLHSNMLGLRLTEGPPNRLRPSSTNPGAFSVLLGHLGDLVDTVLYPSEQGQIRTAEEIAQTIDLFTYDLETTEFAPSEAKRETPVAEAERAVYRYFEKLP